MEGGEAMYPKCAFRQPLPSESWRAATMTAMGRVCKLLLDPTPDGVLVLKLSLGLWRRAGAALG